MIARMSLEELSRERESLLAFLSVPRLTLPRRRRFAPARILQLRAKRFSHEQIAQIMGCSVPTVARVLKESRR